MELSHFGAKVIYPPTIQPALDRGIPIRILNTFNPSFVGTTIAADANPSRYPVRGISSISSTALVRVQGPGMVGVTGIAMRLFGSPGAPARQHHPHLAGLEREVHLFRRGAPATGRRSSRR